jgi:CHRD domain
MDNKMKYVFAALIAALSLGFMIPSTVSTMVVYAQQSQPQGIPGQFVANLSGKNLSPQVNSNASGQASFNATNQASKMAYSVKAHGLDKVSSVSLEYTTGGRSRDIILLYDSVMSGPTGKINGVLTQGSFSPSGFLSDFSGKHISDLVKAMADGNIFLRVRTISFPLGEIGGKVTPNIK